MDSRTGRFWVILVASALVWMTLVGAGVVRAANTPPLADAWNITSSGKATSSGELLLRVSPGDGRDPVEVTVYVLSGTNETGVASSIRRALTTQLDQQRFDVEAGEGANVLVRADSPNKGFSIELVDSDVGDVRVSVQSASPVAPPTIRPQQEPATPPAVPADARPATPSAPAGAPASPSPPEDSARPEGSTPNQSPAPNPSPQPNQDPAPNERSAPTETPAPAGEASPASGGAGAPASAPPPPPGN